MRRWSAAGLALLSAAGAHLNAIYGYLVDRLADDDLAAPAEITTSATTAFIWAGSYLASQELWGCPDHQRIVDVGHYPHSRSDPRYAMAA